MDGRLRRFQVLHSPLVVRFRTLNHPLADLPSEVLTSMPPKSLKNPLFLCPCGCNRLLTQWPIQQHLKLKLQASIGQHESPPPPKQHRITHFQADASSSSGHPQLDVPLFEFNPSLPSVDPPAASDPLQSPVDAHTEASGRFVDDFLLNLHTQTHQTTDDSDSEDFEDALEGDGVEAAHTIDPETDDFGDGEDIDTEDDVDPREGIVSDWDILAEELIVEVEKLGKFEYSLSHTPWLTGIFVLRQVFYLGP